MGPLDTMFMAGVNTASMAQVAAQIPCAHNSFMEELDAPHPAYQRLQDALAQISGQKIGPTEVVRLLGIGQSSRNPASNATNWSKRGVPTGVAIEAQRRFGISATWVLDGSGPVQMGSQSVQLDVARLALALTAARSTILQAGVTPSTADLAELVARAYSDVGHDQSVTGFIVSTLGEG